MTDPTPPLSHAILDGDWEPSWESLGRAGVSLRGRMNQLSAELSRKSGLSGDFFVSLRGMERDLARLEQIASTEDFFRWCRRYIPRQVNRQPASMHQRVVADLSCFLNREEPDPVRFPGADRYGAYALPRGHGKSTLLGFAWPLYLLCNWKKFDLFGYDDENGERQIDQRPFIVIISATEWQAADRVRAIRVELERNQELAEDYGDLRTYGRGIKWSDHDLITADGSRIVCAGMDTAFRGLVEGESRPNVVLLDDIDDKKTITTTELRNKAARKISEEVIGLGIEGEFMMVAWGTILHYDSVLARLLDTAGEFQGYVRRKYKALPDEDTLDQKAGEVAFPAKWPKHLLLRRKKSIPPLAWSTEYQNEPMDDSTTVFPMHWLRAAMGRGADRETPIMPLLPVEKGGEFIVVAQGWDLAFVDNKRHAEKKRTSFNAGITGAVDIHGNLHLCHLIRNRGLNPLEMDEMISANAALLEPDVVVIEANHAGHVHIHTIREETGIPVVGRTTGVEVNDLYKGVPALQRPFANGQVIMWCGDEYGRRMMEAIVEELHRFPQGRRGDTVMALWHLWSVLRPAMMKAERLRKEGVAHKFRETFKLGDFKVDVRTGDDAE